jgi:hypothetical protein
MDADRHANLGPQALDTPGLSRLTLVAGRKNDQRALQAGLSSPRDDGIELGRKDFVGEVAMRIDHVQQNGRAHCTRPFRVADRSR